MIIEEVTPFKKVSPLKVLDAALYVQLSVAVLITTLLASLYPAKKAVKLNPVEALQKI